MRLYCTSKNSGPNWSVDHVHLIYLGSSLEEALDAVGDFVIYERPESTFPKVHQEVYSAIPIELKREFVRFYRHEDQWYSIVQVEVSAQPTVIPGQESLFTESRGN